MSVSIRYHRALLVRAAPGSASGRRAREQAEAWRDAGRLLVFFHGNGVEHATGGGPRSEWSRLASWYGVDLAVCSGSWSRRQEEAPPEPFALSSLATFWNAAIDADKVVCCGASRER